MICWPLSVLCRLSILETFLHNYPIILKHFRILKKYTTSMTQHDNDSDTIFFSIFWVKLANRTDNLQKHSSLLFNSRVYPIKIFCTAKSLFIADYYLAKTVAVFYARKENLERKVFECKTFAFVDTCLKFVFVHFNVWLLNVFLFIRWKLTKLTGLQYFILAHGTPSLCYIKQQRLPI